MRRRCAVLMLLVACGAPALLAPVAAAGPGPARRPIVTSPATPLPTASALVVKTTAMLPGAAYPWVQPVWATVGHALRPTVRLVPAGHSTQPPATIRITA